MNIHDWKVSYNGVVVAQVLTFTPNISTTKVLTRSLDGTVYTQTIGSGLHYAKVEMLCTREEIALVNQGESEGGVFTVVYRGITYIGYFESPPEWEAVSAGEWYKTEMTLLIEEEVPA